MHNIHSTLSAISPPISEVLSNSLSARRLSYSTYVTAVEDTFSKSYFLEKAKTAEPVEEAVPVKKPEVKEPEIKKPITKAPEKKVKLKIVSPLKGVPKVRLKLFLPLYVENITSVMLHVIISS